MRERIWETWEPEMRQEIQSRLDEEIRAGMWDKEREKMRAQLEKELLPAILIGGRVVRRATGKVVFSSRYAIEQ